MVRDLFKALSLVVALAFFCACQSGTSDGGLGGGAGGGTGEGGSTTTNDPATPPDYFENFSSSAEVTADFGFHGTPLLSAADLAAEDGFSAKIYLVGDETVNYNEKTSPSNGSSLSTKELFGYGRYEFRARAESVICASDEEVITGLFTYSYGGDANANGITDNNEIDFEFACSDPTKLSLTVWTDYQSGSRRKVSRVIDMTSGSYKQTEKGTEGEYGTSHDPVGTLDISTLGTFEPQNKFYVYGFEWKADSIKFYLRDGDKEVVLWNFPEPNWDETFIPVPPSEIHMNVWHTTPRWFGIDGLPYDDVANRGDWPANDEFLYVDWIKFWKF